MGKVSRILLLKWVKENIENADNLYIGVSEIPTETLPREKKKKKERSTRFGLLLG